MKLFKIIICVFIIALIAFMASQYKKEPSLSGYYLFKDTSFVDEKDLKILDRRGHILNENKNSLIYVDFDKLLITYYKYGFEKSVQLSKVGNDYIIVGGRFSNAVIEQDGDNILIKGLILIDSSAGVTYDAEFTYLEEKSEKLKDLLAGQIKGKVGSSAYLNKLAQSLKSTMVEPYQGIYNKLDDLFLVNFKGDRTKTSLNELEQKFSEGQIKIPLAKVELKSYIYKVTLASVETFFGRGINYIFTMQHASKVKQADSQMITVRDMSIISYAVEGSVAAQIIQFKAPQESIDWNVILKNIVFNKSLILYSEGDAHILYQDETENLLAISYMYDELKGVHTLGLSGESTSKLKDIKQRFNLVKSLVNKKPDHTLNFQNIMKMQPTNFFVKYGKYLKFNDPKALSDYKKIIEEHKKELRDKTEKFRDSDKDFFSYSDSVQVKDKKGYSVYIPIKYEIYKKNYTKNNALVNLSKPWFKVILKEGTFAIACDSIIPSDKRENDSTEIGVCNQGSNPDFVARYAFEKNGVIYVASSSSSGWSGKVDGAKELNAISFYQLMKIANFEGTL